MHRLRPSRRPTATRTASSLSRKPQLAIGSASNQSPLCGAVEAKNLAFCEGYFIYFLRTQGTQFLKAVNIEKK